MEQHFLQSKTWENLEKSEGKQTFRVKTDDFEFFACLESTPIGKYLYCPYGPTLSRPSSLKKALNALKKLGKSENAIFIRIEPTLNLKSSLKKSGLKKSHDLNPADTWVLDLPKDENTLKSKLPSRLLRYYRNAEKNGLKITTSKNPDDVHFLSKLQNSLAKEKNIGTFDESHYKNELSAGFATLYLVKKEDEVLAAGLVFDDHKTRYNLQGAQSATGAKLHATGILTIQLIFDAKEKDLKTFDFWGIAPEDANKNHPWAGFTAFKKSFAGTPIHYSGTHDLPLNPLKYKLYLFLRTANRLKRKIIPRR